MRKVIKGRTYDTETAKVIAEYETDQPSSDLGWYKEALYRNNRGTWFLAGSGGPMTKYAVAIEANSWEGGTEIIPLTEDEAREWAEKYMAAEAYARIFGEPEEAGDLTTRVRVNVSLDTELYAALRGYSEETGMPVSRLLDRGIEWVLGRK